MKVISTSNYNSHFSFNKATPDLIKVKGIRPLLLTNAPCSDPIFPPGDGYNTHIGSSISYPNSPTAEYYSNNGIAESEIQEKVDLPNTPPQMPHHHHFSPLMGPAAPLGRHSARFGKSPFCVVVPGTSNPTATPPACLTPQNSLPLLDSLDSRERMLPEFSTFGGNGYNLHQNLPKPRNEAIEPSGHLV